MYNNGNNGNNGNNHNTGGHKKRNPGKTSHFTIVTVGHAVVVTIGEGNETIKMQVISIEHPLRTRWVAVQKIVSHTSDGGGQWILMTIAIK